VHLANARSAQHARVALDAAGRHLMAATADGELKWATPQASRLLNMAAGNEVGQAAITREIARWLGARGSAGFSTEAPLAIGLGDRASLHLNYLGEVGANEILFRITSATKEADDEILKRQFGLTAREAEVLVWISKGKANRDIGEILGLSSRTVNKHLEQIYVKLGVENRASAAVKAAAVLHEG